MAKKLKKLEITSTDLVDRGANPDAFIGLFKGVGKVFGGKEPPEEDSVEKAETFKEALEEEQERAQRRELSSEMFDFCYALSDSLASIICDGDLTKEEKRGLLEKSLEQFTTALSDAVPKWADGQTCREGDVTHVEKEEPEEVFEKLCEENGMSKSVGAGAISHIENPLQEDINKSEEEPKEEEEMKQALDIAKMSAEDAAVFEELKKKYSVAQEEEEAPQPEVQKAVEQPTEEMNPEVRKALNDLKQSQEAKDAEIEELKKSLELSKLVEVAKKYEVIGKNPEELAKKLYDYKQAGGTIFDEMLAIMDEQVNIQAQSPMFHEIGKSTQGEGYTTGQIQGLASEVAKNNDALSKAESIVKAFETNPAMLAEYEKEYGGQH